jgi:hypothetical protein
VLPTAADIKPRRLKTSQPIFDITQVIFLVGWLMLKRHRSISAIGPLMSEMSQLLLKVG